MGEGGLVLRFAGPRLTEVKGPILPVRLRQGDRELGGALSWTKPASLAAFPANSPFAGLAVPKGLDFSDYDVVYAFLSPEPMPALYEKVRREMKPGTRFVSNSFSVAEAPPDDTVIVGDRRRTKLHIWNIP